MNFLYHRKKELGKCSSLMDEIITDLQQKRPVDRDRMKAAYEGVRVQNTNARTEIASMKLSMALHGRKVRPPRSKK